MLPQKPLEKLSKNQLELQLGGRFGDEEPGNVTGPGDVLNFAGIVIFRLVIIAFIFCA